MTDTSRGRTCQTCRFFEPEFPEDPVIQSECKKGECRIRAPVYNSGSSFGNFPPVKHNIWCGEHKRFNQLDNVIETMVDLGDGDCR